MELTPLSDLIKYGAVGLAFLATVFSFLVSAWGKPRTLHLLSNDREEQRDITREVRLPEVARSLDEEESRKRRYGFAATSLAFGQFIIGGLLASSFVADNLSKVLIGFLGLLVLAASLVHQHFRPDVLQKAAAHRVFRLKAFRRWVEDEVYDITRLDADDERVATLRRKVSELLGEIERDSLNSEKNEKA